MSNGEEISCIRCNSTNEYLLQIIKDGYETDEYICQSCVEDDADYGECKFCDDKAYLQNELNEDYECQTHFGESKMDPDEEEGWEDNIDKWSEQD